MDTTHDTTTTPTGAATALASQLPGPAPVGAAVASPGPVRRRASARLLTIGVVADQLSYSRATVYRLIAAGDLVGVGRGRGLRVLASSVDHWIEVNTVPVADGGRGA